MRFLLLLFLAFFLSACNLTPNYYYTRIPPNPTIKTIITVRIDKTFSYDDKVGIDNALNTWNYALNNYIAFRVVSTDFDMEPDDIKHAYMENSLLILKIDSSNSIVPSSKTGGDVMAFTNEVGGRQIFVVRDRIWDEKTLYDVMLHEIGHSLGCDDLHNKRALMNAQLYTDYAQCVDYDAVVQVAKYQRLDPAHLNYCVYEDGSSSS